MTFLLHPLIRDWLQLREKGRQRRAFTRESVDVIVNSIRVFEQRGTVASTKQSLLLHMDASLRNDAEFSKSGHRLGQEVSSCGSAGWFASFYREQGRYNSSFELEAVAWKTTINRLGKEHPSTLTSMSNLAAVLNDQRKYEESASVTRAVLEVQRERLGPHHASTLLSVNDLGVVLMAEEKLEEAETLYRQLVADAEAHLEAHDPNLSTYKINLASVLFSNHKLTEATDLLLQGPLVDRVAVEDS